MDSGDVLVADGLDSVAPLLFTLVLMAVVDMVGRTVAWSGELELLLGGLSSESGKVTVC